ncbi:unnamed protein product [Meloidogyne enterolobii]|uniref:Uncharacterized protein n=1 Tax=Meloidogyne enterolobii TaxID=390850 RepID=A0ACB1A9V9_MELEN
MCCFTSFSNLVIVLCSSSVFVASSIPIACLFTNSIFSSLLCSRELSNFV